MEAWPAIPYPEWEKTCATLQLWTQIVGKIRLALTPWVNHSWHVVLYLTPRGLTTSPIPYRSGAFQIDFDFLSQGLTIENSEGDSRRLKLRPQSVADFYTELMSLLREIQIEVHIDRIPNEVADPISFDRDQEHRDYDGAAAQRFHRALLSSYLVLSEFRSGFLGKVSPAHFFWGSFDLAVTRFSGRTAPLHPGGHPGLPDAVSREAYSHEVSSAGFWPGNGGLGYPAFYSYAYPQPEGYPNFPVGPVAAFYDQGLGEFLLPYDAVRTAADPAATLLEFLETTYRAAAEAGRWDRTALECPRGRPAVPRPLSPP
jgi:hypothetical protein